MCDIADVSSSPERPDQFHCSEAEGVSGVVLADLCQRAGKADIRDAIAAEELKAGDGGMDVKAASEIGREHSSFLLDGSVIRKLFGFVH